MPERPRSVPVRRDDIVDVRVETFGDGPDGLCRIDGYIFFVAEAIPGELVRARVVSAARKFGRGELLEVLEPSPDRVAPRCQHFGTCGGCQFQHVSHAAQLAAKEDRLRRQLAFTLRREPEQIPLRASRTPDDPWELRTKLALHFRNGPQGLEAGFFGRRSRELVPIVECPAQEPLGLRIGLAARDGAEAAGLRAWDPERDTGTLRAVVVRSSGTTGQAHATIVVRDDRRLPSLTPLVDALRAAGAVGAAISPNDGPPELLMGDSVRRLYGEQHIEDDVLGMRFRTSAGAFFQTSSFGVRALVEVVRKVLADAPSDCRIADLYCGGGLLGLALAPHVGRVYGIEEDPRAVEDAIATAEALGFENTNFRAGRVENLIANVARLRDKPFAAIVDPPRAGCDVRILNGLVQRLQPKRIVYVSCDPASLARDAAKLCEKAYALREVVPIEMFPHTARVEAVAVFERRVPRTDPVKERLLARLRAAETRPAAPPTVPPEPSV